MNNKKQPHTLRWLRFVVLAVFVCVLGALTYESFQGAHKDNGGADFPNAQQSPQEENPLPKLTNATNELLGTEHQEIEPFNSEVLQEVVGQDNSSDAFEFHLYAADKNLIDCVTEVLKAYEQIDTLSVEVSGYLDLFGDVWGCLIRNETQWIDVMLVESDEYDEHSYLSIVRIRPTKE